MPDRGPRFGSRSGQPSFLFYRLPSDAGTGYLVEYKSGILLMHYEMLKSFLGIMFSLHKKYIHFLQVVFKWIKAQMFFFKIYALCFPLIYTAQQKLRATYLAAYSSNTENEQWLKVQSISVLFPLLHITVKCLMKTQMVFCL